MSNMYSCLERITISERDAEIGGLRGFQNWLEDKGKLLTDPEVRDGMVKRSPSMPRGVLLVGIPGCGKSVSAKFIAAKWKWPLYRLDFAMVQGSYAGQSEKQLKDALTMAEQVSPCILWIDEIEKGLPAVTGGRDGETATRMLKQFLFWLRECEKPVFVAATANDVFKIPAELSCRDYLDEIFFMDLPNQEERKAILSQKYQIYTGQEMPPDLNSKLALISEGFSGADLESAMRDAGFHMILHPGEQMTEQEISELITNIIPFSRCNPDRIEKIRAWGRDRAIPASGCPFGETADKLQFLMSD